MTGSDDAFTRIAKDAGLRAILKTARVWGVSPRRFLGWEPTRTYVYKDGRLTGEILEVEWDEESRDLAIAYAMWESDLCPGCNRPMVETTLADNEGRYVAAQPIRCHSCTAHQAASEAYAEAPQSQALFVPVEFRSPHAVQDEDNGA